MMATADTVSEFLHDPLDNPRACIRLLRILSIDSARDVPVHCELSTWPNIDGAPKYNAISYTWGDITPTPTILINGQRLSVRTNCEFALRQTSPHIKGGYLWIDAVCINQSDNDEKSEQVAKMGEVFKKAIQVFACVGEHKDDSELLCNIMQRDERYFRSWRSSLLRKIDADYAHWYYLPQVSLWKLKLTFRDIKVSRLREALRAFLARSYFHRVWVYQELFLAQVVNVVCGHDIIPMSYLWMTSFVLHLRLGRYQITWLLHWEPENDMRIQQTLLHTGSASQESISLRKMVVGLAALHCQDSRDRVYGTLSIINWKGREPIQPDYNKDRFDLAVEVLKRLADVKSDFQTLLFYAGLIGATLELDSKPSRRQTDLIRDRHFPNQEATNTEQPWTTNDRRDGVRIDTCYATGLRLSCQNGQWRFQQDPMEEVMKIYQWRNESPTRTPLSSFDLLLPPEAQDGDCLLSTGFDLLDSPINLLARYNDDLELYELVGKALRVESEVFPRRWKRLVNNSDLVFKAYLDAEDVFCLISSFIWTDYNYCIGPWDEETVTGYFKARLCRERYSSFAVRENINRPDFG